MKEKKENIVALAEFAIAELQALNEEITLADLRKHLQESINLLNEADEDLMELEQKIGTH